MRVVKRRTFVTIKFIKSLLVTILIVAALALTACGAAAPSEPAAPAEESAAPQEEAAAPSSADSTVDKEPVTLTYWHAGPGPPLEPAMQKLVDQFEEEYPWITVNVEAFGFGEYFQKLDTATAGGSPPDVFWVDTTAIQQYTYFDTIIPLTKFVPDNYADDWFTIPKEDMTHDGEIWAIPLHQSTEAMVYNQDIIDEAGLDPPKSYDQAWNFAQFRDALEKVTKKADDGTVEVWGWTTQYPPGTYNVQPLMYADGATYLNDAGDTYEGYTNSPKAVEALQWYADLFKDGLAPIDRVPDMFQTGKVAFLQTNPFVLVDLQQRYPDLNFGVMPMPCEEQCAVQSGAWHIGIHSQSKHPEESWMLIDYLTNKEGHKQWIEESGYMPARKSVYEEMPKMKEYPWDIFMDGLINYAVHRPGNVAWPIFNTEMTNAAINVATGADPKAELDRVAKASDEELANYK